MKTNFTQKLFRELFLRFCMLTCQTFLLTILLLGFSNKSLAQTLGTCNPVTLVSGTNTTISPSIAPSNTTSLVAYTNTNF
jgi:hypothetical protein